MPTPDAGRQCAEMSEFWRLTGWSTFLEKFSPIFHLTYLLSAARFTDGKRFYILMEITPQTNKGMYITLRVYIPFISCFSTAEQFACEDGVCQIMIISESVERTYARTHRHTHTQHSILWCHQQMCTYPRLNTIQMS